MDKIWRSPAFVLRQDSASNVFSCRARCRGECWCKTPSTWLWWLGGGFFFPDCRRQFVLGVNSSRCCCTAMLTEASANGFHVCGSSWVMPPLLASSVKPAALCALVPWRLGVLVTTGCWYPTHSQATESFFVGVWMRWLSGSVMPHGPYLSAHPRWLSWQSWLGCQGLVQALALWGTERCFR